LGQIQFTDVTLKTVRTVHLNSLVNLAGALKESGLNESAQEHAEEDRP
jgi:hypothetical protein